jgi:hypothetical protein
LSCSTRNGYMPFDDSIWMSFSMPGRYSLAGRELPIIPEEA